jgi:hypothetical protein
VKHYEAVTKQAEELLEELENDRPNLTLQLVVIKAETAMGVLWPSIREATFELAEMQAVYQCLECIRVEAMRGLPAPSELLKKRTKKEFTPDDLIRQFQMLPADKIKRLIYNLERGK